MKKVTKTSSDLSPETVKILTSIATKHLYSKQFLEKFPGAKMYLVGGFVRDAIIMGPDFSLSDTKDIDLVVTGITPEELTSFFEKHGKIIKAGTIFEVYKFSPTENPKKLQIDIAFPRKEQSTGAGHRQFVMDYQNVTLEDDLSRRDFTINSLAFDIGEGELIDPFNGLSDLDAGIIKAVGDPDKRFEEDPLRILRAIRFSAEFGFKIESKTSVAMKDDAHLIFAEIKEDNESKQAIADERIHDEFMKSVNANLPITIDYFEALKIQKNILPQVYALTPDKISNTRSIIEDENIFAYKKSLTLKLAALFFFVSKASRRKQYKHLKMSNRRGKEIDYLISLVKTFTSGHIIDKLSPDELLKLASSQTKQYEVYDLSFAYSNVADDVDKVMSEISFNEHTLMHLEGALVSANFTDFKGIIDGHAIMDLGFKDSEIGDKLNIAKKYIIKYIFDNSSLPSIEEVIKTIKK